MDLGDKMKKLVLINENKRTSKNIKEGGASRSVAWQNYFEKNSFEQYFVSNNRIISAFQIYIYLLKSRNKRLMFLYPTVGVPMNSESIIGHIFAYLFVFCCKYSSKRNMLIFDICDLKYEQFKDLQIKFSKMDYLKRIEKMLFSVDAKFIFASKSMMNYAKYEYCLSEEKIEYCENGASISDFVESEYYVDQSIINYVYAGTLNQGRNIEKMIKSFPSNNSMKLILMGTGGEWLNNLSSNNIEYIGPKNETEAHSIVKKCDIGLIPYDDTKSYYNIAYPTKLPFYLSAGTPYLSTPVDEVKYSDLSQSFGWQIEIDNWEKAFFSISKSEIIYKKENIKNNKDIFLWDNIFSKSKFVNKD